MRKFWLWLMRHGIELEAGDSGYVAHTHSISIAINHRYICVEFAFMVKPSVGVYADELDTPHAKIAALYEKDGAQ